MTPAERLAQAATELTTTARLLEDDPLAASCAHLARAARVRAKMLDATVHVELPHQDPQLYTVRQEGSTIIIIQRETGERRFVGLLEFTACGGAAAAWAALERPP